MTLFLDKKVNDENWTYTYEDNLIKKKKTKECKNRLTIKENGIIFD